MGKKKNNNKDDKKPLQDDIIIGDDVNVKDGKDMPYHDKDTHDFDL